jgi:hypothetical protein
VLGTGRCTVYKRLDATVMEQTVARVLAATAGDDRMPRLCASRDPTLMILAAAGEGSVPRISHPEP